MEEIKIPNSFVDYLVSSKESHKLFLNMIRDTHNPVDFETMSMETELSTWIIDIYGQSLNWVNLLQGRKIPDHLIQKHQNKFDEAISSLLNDIF